MSSVPQLSSQRIDDIVERSSRAAGLPHSRSSIRRQLDLLAERAIVSAKFYKIFSLCMTITIGLFPFVVAQIAANIADMHSKILIVSPLIVVWSLLIVINYVLPKDIADQALRVEVIRSRLLIHRLAGQLALHSLTRDNSSAEDETTIMELSAVLNDNATAALNEIAAKLPAIVGYRNADWQETCLTIPALGISDALDKQLLSIVESIAIASADIFNNGRFTIKLYVTTSHVVDLPRRAEIKLLTAVGRYPPKRKGHGVSWIQSSGARAEVWTAQQENRVLVHKWGKSASGRLYASIAYLPLPDGLGVITIESDDPETFCQDRSGGDEDKAKKPTDEKRIPVKDHIIDEDLHMAIALTVKDLAVKAIRADQSFKSIA